MPSALRLWMGAVALVATGAHAMTGCSDPAEPPMGNPNLLARGNLPGPSGPGAADAGTSPVPGTGSGTATCADGIRSVPFEGDCPSFARDIYPYMGAGASWRCAEGTCHGGATKPSLTCTDADSCLTQLSAVTVNGRAFLPDGGASDPTAAGMLCILQGTCGSRMPKAPGNPVTPAELCLVETWIRCGAPR